MKTESVKILQIVGAMNMGGAETFLMNALRCIDRRQYEFIFLCYLDGAYDYSNDIHKLGAKIVRIPDTRITNPALFIKNIERVIMSENIDIVHSHVDFTSGYAMVAAQKSGVKKRIAHAHSTSTAQSTNILKNIWVKVLRGQMNQRATERLACSADAGKFMFGPGSFQIVRNGIDIARFKFDEAKRAQIRRELNIGDTDIVLLHSGRFEAVKNHEFLINVFSEHYARDNSSKLILLGDGTLFNSIRDQVSDLGLEDAVRMLGKKSNTEDYYSASDLFIMPSLYEGLPLTLIEAQMNGLHCLVSDTVDSAVNYGCVNFYSLSNTAEDWSSEINIVDKSRTLASRRLENDYDIKNVAFQLEQFYGKK